MNPQPPTTDGTLPPPIVPDHAKPLVPNLVTGAGAVMLVLGFAAVRQDPTLAGLVDWNQLLGIIVIIAGQALHTTNNNGNQKAAVAAIETNHAIASSAVDVAETSPPADLNGKKSSAATFAAGVEQAMNEQNHALAMAVVKAVSENPRVTQ